MWRPQPLRRSFVISFRPVRNFPIEAFGADAHSAGITDASAMNTTSSQLVSALIKGMRRAESARVASLAYRAGPDDQLGRCGTPDNAEKVLEMFKLDPEQIRDMGLVGVEELGEAVCHAWSINAGQLDRVAQWFTAPRVEFVGKHCRELVQAGRIGPVLTMAREQALLRHR